MQLREVFSSFPFSFCLSLVNQGLRRLHSARRFGRLSRYAPVIESDLNALAVPRNPNSCGLGSAYGSRTRAPALRGCYLLDRSVQVAILWLFSSVRMKRILLAHLGVNRASNER